MRMPSLALQTQVTCRAGSFTYFWRHGNQRRSTVMKTLTSYLFPVVLILVGGALLIMGAQQGQNSWVMLGAGLALIAGVAALLIQMGILNRKAGTMIGIIFAVVAVFLTYRNYRSVAEVQEFTEKKRQNDRKVIQGLKDIRTAQLGYRQATGGFTESLDVLRDFVKSGTIPIIRAIGQVPDTLSEREAFELGIIVRDTIQAPVLDSLFMTTGALEGRTHPFDPDKFILSPTSGQRYLMAAGNITSSGHNVPVFLAKDPTPMVAGDTLMVGNMEKASTAGNWSGE